MTPDLQEDGSKRREAYLAKQSSSYSAEGSGGQAAFGRVVGDEVDTAHHVGASWMGLSTNPRSIGIEMSNIGRYPHWGDSRYQAFTVPYTKAQIDSLRALLAQLKNDLPNLRWIAGHEDLDQRLEPAKDDPSIQLRRRQDPGPLFPWNEVLDGSDLVRFDPDAH